MSLPLHITTLSERLTQNGHDVSLTLANSMVAHGYCTCCQAAFTVSGSDHRYKVVGIPTSTPCPQTLTLKTETASPVALRVG